MSSFASQVKNELVHVLGGQICCKMAELAALLRMGATISFNSKHDFGINFVTENAAVARKILSLLKTSVPKIHSKGHPVAGNEQHLKTARLSVGEKSAGRRHGPQFSAKRLLQDSVSARSVSGRRLGEPPGRPVSSGICHGQLQFCPPDFKFVPRTVSARRHYGQKKSLYNIFEGKRSDFGAFGLNRRGG